jgi:hypothetical protein
MYCRLLSSVAYAMLYPCIYSTAAYLVNRLRSVLKSAARLVFGLRRTNHESVALTTLHGLRVPELVVLVFRVLQAIAPDYLGPFQRVATHPGRRHLRSASITQLLVPPVRLATVGTRAFAVADPTVWNSLYLLMSHLTVVPFSGAALKHSYIICLSLTLLFKPLPRGLAAFILPLFT